MTSQNGYVLPDEAPVNLLQSNLNTAKTIPPTAEVLCINRGRELLTDKFDGLDISMPPGFFRIEYGAAKHFQNRLIVKGTRNLEVGGFVSWLGILGQYDGVRVVVPVDPPERCVPFTDEELQRYGEAIEGIDRQAISDPASRDVRVVPTMAAVASSRGMGMGGRGIDASAQVSELAREAAEHVLDTPPENAARAAQVEAAAAGHVPVAPNVTESVRVRTPGRRSR